MKVRSLKDLADALSNILSERQHANLTLNVFSRT
jgi:hypothetical protein